MIQETLEQTVTTVTTMIGAPPLEVTVSLWFSLFATAMSLFLGGLKAWEWWTSRTAKWLNLLVPKLREIRALMKTDRFVDASDSYTREIYAKGFEPALGRISGRVDRDHHLPSLFFKLWYCAGAANGNVMPTMRVRHCAHVNLTKTRNNDSIRLHWHRGKDGSSCCCTIVSLFVAVPVPATIIGRVLGRVERPQRYIILVH